MQKDAASSSADVKKEGAAKKSHSEKSATQVLFEHREKLAGERAKKILIERQMSTVPKLGRGFSSGEEGFA